VPPKRLTTLLTGSYTQKHTIEYSSHNYTGIVHRSAPDAIVFHDFVSDTLVSIYFRASSVYQWTLIHGLTFYHCSSRSSAATWRQSEKHGLTENYVHYNPWHLWRHAFRETLTWARCNGRTTTFCCTTNLRTATSNDGRKFPKKLGNEWNKLVIFKFYIITTTCTALMFEIFYRRAVIQTLK